MYELFVICKSHKSTCYTYIHYKNSKGGGMKAATLAKTFGNDDFPIKLMKNTKPRGTLSMISMSLYCENKI